jgi:hypothetical protein
MLISLLLLCVGAVVVGVGLEGGVFTALQSAPYLFRRPFFFCVPSRQVTV